MRGIPRPLLNRNARHEPLTSSARQYPRENRLRQLRRHAGVAPGRGDFAITYDPMKTDGVGAQLQRIYSLYALARSLHVKYVHTPMEEVGYQGFLPLLTGTIEPDFAARYNAFFSLPSDEFDLENCERVRTMDQLDQATVERYRKYAADAGRPVLLQGLSGYGYTDTHPECYRVVRTVSPYRNHRAGGPIRVCVHVRRGDNVPDRKDRRYRWLPNEYYLRVCGAVVETLQKQDAPFIVRLHTEMPARNYTIHPGIPGLYFRLEQPSIVGPRDSALEDFDVLPNLETVLNVEAREALDDFATADVLILSCSSFSYLGGLLNPHGQSSMHPGGIPHSRTGWSQTRGAISTPLNSRPVSRAYYGDGASTRRDCSACCD